MLGRVIAKVSAVIAHRVDKEPSTMKLEKGITGVGREMKTDQGELNPFHHDFIH